ncbi:MAG: AIR synthase-related protein [Blautia sp.]|nr:AIR synthase-related protein [Lachnoclostridium sp.]MCM1211659.1 AIR synthase-related protein [Blautia sp.]
MRNGKVSENVLIRSVLRKIKSRREEVICGAGIGIDCAVLSFGEGEETLCSTNPICAPTDRICVYGIHRALNNLAAAGAEPVGVLLSYMLPEGMEESILQDMMQQADTICAAHHVQIIGGHTEIAAGVREPVLTVTGVGKRKRGCQTERENGRPGQDEKVSKMGIARPGQDEKISKMGIVRPGQDVVVSKWIGLEGSVRIARECREALRRRYPERMIDEAAEFERFLSVIPEAATAVKSGVCGMHDVSQGGIFGALWELAEKAGVGLEIDLKKLPIRQETVELCEFYDLNPYELLSGGALLMTTEDGTALVSALDKEGIPAVIAGRTTAGNDRVLYNGEEKRFLELPKADQIYYLYQKKGKEKVWEQ